MTNAQCTTIPICRRALPALHGVAGDMVRAIIRWSVVFALLFMWYYPLESLAQGQDGQSAIPSQSPWRIGEITATQSWYWGEVAKVPAITGGYRICAPIVSGQRCVLVTQGQYRYLIADGILVEDRRYRLRLLQVWR